MFHAFRTQLPGGFIGVDVFFVISGFLITGIIRRALEADEFSFATFYRHRITRIFPALVLMLATALLVGWFTSLLDEYRQLGKHVAAGVLFSQNLVLWSEAGYFDAASDNKPLLHLWSLGVEEQFYLLFPLIMWASLRIRRVRPVLMVSAMAVVSFVSSLWMTSRDSNAAFFLPQYRLWELCAGGLLSFGEFVAVSKIGREISAAVGAALLVLGVFTFDASTPFPGWAAIVPVVGAALLIFAGATAGVNRHILARPLMVGIGLISYPLYLWHWPVLTFLRLIEPDPPSRLARAAAVFVSVALAWATFRFVERPLRSAPRTIQVKGLMAAASIVAIAGMIVVKKDGVIARFAPNLRTLVAYRYNPDAVFRSGTCFHHPRAGQTFTSAVFASTCTATDTRKPSVLIWGDSFAASLYAGIQSAYREVNVWQLTQAMCPPILDLADHTSKDCSEMNAFVLRTIANRVPDTVLLSGRWPGYDWKQLDRTISALRRLHVLQVVVVGSPPWWRMPLPDVIQRDVLRRALVAPPVRLRPEALANQQRFDDELHGFASSNGAEFVSLLRLLCDNSGNCLVRDVAGAEPLAPLAFDEQHLTASGSVLLGRLLHEPHSANADATLVIGKHAMTHAPLDGRS